jgi:hypothetical protein
MDRYAPVVKKAIDRRMRMEGKYVTGKTARGVSVKSFERSERIGLRASSTKRFNVMHTGRRPGATPPPAQEIKQWIQNKPGFNPKKSIDSAAYAVAKSIGERGFAGKDIWGMALESVLSRILNDTSEAYIKDVEKHLKKTSKDA